MQVLKERLGILFMRSKASLASGNPKNINAINVGRHINPQSEAVQGSARMLVNLNGGEKQVLIISKLHVFIARKHS
jgi:hypothetical protein